MGHQFFKKGDLGDQTSELNFCSRQISTISNQRMNNYAQRGRSHAEETSRSCFTKFRFCGSSTWVQVSKLKFKSKLIVR